MTDEKYTFIEDVREKKKTATGAHHKRTHCGKGGAIRFPSDFKTKKELKAMNGEVKSYKLNDPMSWAEFKAMPDDIKRNYITALRKKYNVSDKKIAEMLGVEQTYFSSACRKLGIKSTRKSREKWDADGWYAWVNGVKLEAKEEAEEVPVIEEKLEKRDEEVLEEAEKCDVPAADGWQRVRFRFGKDGITVVEEVQPAVPGWGQMELEGTVAECAKTLEMLLADKRVKLTVAWAVKHEEKACES